MPAPPPQAILGPVDALKLRSCATLFRAAGGGEPFDAILAAFYNGEPCPQTLRMLGNGGAAATAAGVSRNGR
ncbi:MAG: hypothetical protein KatS3mg118_1222 [Paracoccaceae bacterium]|nr:MAG: hypothetical protein KatS3mg118_1222 [Paracoccaceae bacterium]